MNQQEEAIYSKRPNILWFMTDQHHAECLGFMGHPLVKTPNLDALAARGAWFNNMYTCSAICCPSRTSFMTGTYLRTHGHFTNSGDLRRELPSVLSIFNEQGYRTGVCGKSHLPDKLYRQFDWARTNTDYFEELKQRGLSDVASSPEHHLKFMSATSLLPYKEHKIAWTADRAVEFLEAGEGEEQPFMLWCSFGPPHAPHVPPAEMDDLYDPKDVPVDWAEYARFERTRLGQRAMIEDFWKVSTVKQNPETFQKAVCRYLALITMVDQEIGRVMQRLEELGEADNTIVIFTADHGDFAGHYGQIGKNVPGYDDLLRIPMIYFDPTRHDGGRCIEGMHQSIDLMPTLCERIGAEVPPTVQGESFLPSLEGCPGAGREYVFAETQSVKTVRGREWKLNFFGPHPERGQLFRLDPEPDELTNLWDDPTCAHIKSRLLEQLMGWAVQCEQGVAMDWRSEEYVDTRWYKWLRDQPHQCETEENWLNRI